MTTLILIMLNQVSKINFMKSFKKIEVRDTSLHCPFSFWELEGGINVVAEKIKNIPQVLKDTYFVKTELYHKFEFSISTYEDESPDIRLIGYRWESDIEFKNRKEQVKKNFAAAKLSVIKRAEKKKENEIKEYERLKKKFESKL